MKAVIEQRLQAICQQLVAEGDLPAEVSVNPVLTVPKDPAHGDFASNLAMQLAKPMKQSPRAIAERIVAASPTSRASSVSRSPARAS